MIAGVERERLLARMGITVFVPRGAPAPLHPESPPATHRGEGSVLVPDAAAAPAPAPISVSTPAPISPPGAGGASGAGRIPAGPVTAPAAASAGAPPPVSALRWPELEAAVADCVACPLHRSRRRTVFGAGALDADWLVIGEAPGANEDRQGEPFVGRAGRLLNSMLFAIGLSREEVFITNTVKCRPPGNRDPEPAETERCGPFLDRQIELLAPRVILAVGRVAAQALLDTNAPLARLRGREHPYPRGERRVPVVATYHPAYLLRTPIAKRAAWEDLCLARSIAVRLP